MVSLLRIRNKSMKFASKYFHLKSLVEVFRASLWERATGGVRNEGCGETGRDSGIALLAEGNGMGWVLLKANSLKNLLLALQILVPTWIMRP